MSSIIGRGTVLRGTIRGTGDLAIEGRVDGAIDLDGELTLESTSMLRVEGSAVRAASIVARGMVAGSLQASASLVLEEGARVQGDLAAPSVAIRSGALVRGHVETGTSTASKPAAATATAARPAATTASRPAPTTSPMRAAPLREPAVTVREPAIARVASKPAALEHSREPIRNEPARVEPQPQAAQRTAPAAAPAPVMPALRKGQRGAMKKKSGGR